MGIKSLISSKNIGCREIDNNKDGIIDIRCHQGASVYPEAGAAYLLDFNDGTFTRTSEASFVDPRHPLSGGTGDYAWDFVGGSEATNWKGNNEPRIFSDGAILIEGSRTNVALYSEDFTDATWDKAAAATIDADSHTAPDGQDDADTIQLTTNANDGIRQTSALPANDETWRWSTYHRSITGTADWRLQLIGRDGGVVVNTDQTADTTWAFVQGGGDLASGSSDVEFRMSNAAAPDGSDVVGWGTQMEEGSFASTFIRTEGASATRAYEKLQFNGANIDSQMFTKGFEIDIWLNWDSSVARNVYPIWGDAANHLRIAAGSNLLRVSAENNNYDVGSLAWNVGDKITVRCNFQGNLEVFINGVSQGTAAINGAHDWTAMITDSSVYLGSNGGSITIDGVISRPRAL